MQNRVGDHVPTQAEIDKVQRAIDEIRRRIASWTLELSPTERRGLLKFRPGGEKKAELQLHGVERLRAHRASSAKVWMTRYVAPSSLRISSEGSVEAAEPIGVGLGREHPGFDAHETRREGVVAS